MESHALRPRAGSRPALLGRGARLVAATALVGVGLLLFAAGVGGGVPALVFPALACLGLAAATALGRAGPRELPRAQRVERRIQSE